MSDIVNDLDAWFGDYRDDLKASGHDVEGDRCELCWQKALLDCRLFPNTFKNPMDRYRELVRESVDRVRARERKVG